MKKITLFLLLASLIGAEEVQEDIEIDPFEKMNRVVFNISDSIDQNFLRPTAEIYSEYTPLFVKDSVTNFFHNITEIDTVINQLLQGKPKLAAQDTLRFLINTTIGVGGIFDVASRMGLDRHDEDFGQTLGVWGFESGPYIMIPFLGPSNPRDLLSRPISSFLSGTFAMEDNDVKITLVGIDALETRERLLDAETLIIGDKYIFVKDAYIQSREYEINNGSTEDDEFLDDMDDIFGDD